MKEENNKKKKSSGAGFYIALCCCVAAIGIVGFVNSRNENNAPDIVADQDADTETLSMPVITLPPAKNTDSVISVTAEKNVKKDDIVKKAQPTEKVLTEDVDIVEPGENPEFYDGEIVETITLKEIPLLTLPVEGEICFEFTGDELYYDTLLDEYRTHNGIDIKADVDSDVVAAFDGEITETYNGTLGNTVVIDHKNGYKTIYSNLDDITNLNVGMKLKKGDFLAHVGNYKYGEMTTDPHIHFELLCDGEYLNPAEYFE